MVRALFSAKARSGSLQSDGVKEASDFLACREAGVGQDTAPSCALPAVAGDVGMVRSGLYRIHSVGVHPDSRVRVVIEVVVRVTGNKVQEVSWHRE